MVEKKNRKTSEEVEILSNADLKLKVGTCYCLVGRNGSGKSTLLRALGKRLIPGLPKIVKIAALQQTDTTVDLSTLKSNKKKDQAEGITSVLKYVMESDEARSLLVHDLEVLSGGPDGETDAVAQLRRYRRYQYEQMSKDLHELKNQSSLRSGARGAQARKDLLSFEDEVAKVRTRIDEVPQDMESKEVKSALEESERLIGQLQLEMSSISLEETENSSRKILSGLGFDEAMMQKSLDTLSGGWRMRCCLAAVLRENADIMILDEPTNFLDLPGIIWLQRHLQDVRNESEKIVIAVSHDRAFIDEVCDEIIILRDQTLAYYRGNLTEYEADLRSRIKYLTRMKATQEKETERMGKTIRANIKLGKSKGDDNKLRMAKSRQKKLENQSGMQVGVNGGRFKLSRDRAGFQDTKLAAIDIPTFESGISLAIPSATELRHPGSLISLENVRHKYRNTSKNTLDGIDLSVDMGDRVGIMGLNGAGKSTLIKILTNNMKPGAGTVAFHPGFKLGYFSQHAVEELQRQAAENPGWTALSLLQGDAGAELSEQDIRGLLGSYGIQGRIASHTPIAALSGGQLVRLAFCRIIWTAPNILVLDEVSTHLDYHTVTALADALAAFEGAIILASHDRFLVRRLIEGNVGDDNEDSEDGSRDGSDAENASSRRRSVYVMSRGKLMLQEGGVDQFEKSIEKKVLTRHYS